MWARQNATIMPALTLHFAWRWDANCMLGSHHSNGESVVLRFIASSSTKSPFLVSYVCSPESYAYFRLIAAFSTTFGRKSHPQEPAQ